jgi:hypothetical protein
VPWRALREHRLECCGAHGNGRRQRKTKGSNCLRWRMLAGPRMPASSAASSPLVSPSSPLPQCPRPSLNPKPPPLPPLSLFTRVWAQAQVRYRQLMGCSTPGSLPTRLLLSALASGRCFLASSSHSSPPLPPHTPLPLRPPPSSLKCRMACTNARGYLCSREVTARNGSECTCDTSAQGKHAARRESDQSIAFWVSTNRLVAVAP